MASCVTNFTVPPGYCKNPKANSNTGCNVWNQAMTKLASILNGGGQAQGVMNADLASCQTVPASSVVQSGVTMSQVTMDGSSWPGQDVDVSTNLCAQSRYPVFDQTTGKTVVDHVWNLWPSISESCTEGKALPDTYADSRATPQQTSVWKRKTSGSDYFQDWAHDQTKADLEDYPAAAKRRLTAKQAHDSTPPLPFASPPSSTPKQDFLASFYGSQQGNKQQASFTYSCASPSNTCYTMCRLPGWDYVDQSTIPWSFTNKPQTKTCGKAPVPNSKACNNDTNATSGADPALPSACSNGCCVPTFSGSDTCTLCGNTVESNLATAKVSFWTDTSSPDSSTPTGSIALALPYAGPNGVAITPSSDYTGDTSYFGDPVDCYPGGPFNGYCTGLQGCTGTNASDCQQGLSNFQLGAGPAYNCPNIYTLSRQANSCQAPGTNYDSSTAPYSLAGGLNSYSTVTHMFVPEGAYVTAWNLGPTIGFDGGEGLCAPNVQLPKFGVQLMCAREASTSSPTSPCSGAGYQLANNSKAFSIDTSGNYHAEAQVNPETNKGISYNGDVATLNGVCGCYFKNLKYVSGVQNHSILDRGYQGFTFGFMPGYYDKTLQTNQGFCS